MDKTTLKAWFTRGKKPTAAQFAAWMDSYWHKDEPLPTTAIDGLDTLLDEKAVIDDAHTSTATTYSSQRITQLLEAISGSLEPEKDVVAVDTADELLAIESPSSEVLYLVADENVLYRWDGLTFVRVEADNTIYIRNLSDLNTVTDVRDYNVVWTKLVSKLPVRYSASSWSLSVSSGSGTLTQHLANRDGYYVRIASLSATNEPSWSAWKRRTYAMQADVDTLQTTVRWHHAQAKRKHRTTVHYCSSRMKFAMPKVGTTVLIDDCKPHFWGFASFGRRRENTDNAAFAENIGDERYYYKVDSITPIKSVENGKTTIKYQSIESKPMDIPDWVYNYWNAADGTYKFTDHLLYPRIKPIENKDPNFRAWSYSEDGGIAQISIPNATGSTGFALKNTSLNFFATDTSPKQVQFKVWQSISPVVDLCARLVINELIAPTPSAHRGKNRYYAIGDIVRFNGTKWQRIDRLATGRSVRVLYQKIEVERTGESAFCYRRQRITLPEFQSFQFQYTSASGADARNTVAAPADVLNAYLQYVAQHGGSPAFYTNPFNGNLMPRVGTLAIFTKVRAGGKKTNSYATVWHRCLPAEGLDTGEIAYNNKNPKLKAHHLLVPNTNEGNFARNYPWYVDAYIVVVRPVAKFNRSKLGAAAQYEPIIQHKPYHRNIEISNRIPVRIMYIRNEDPSGTCSTTVRVRQFARS